MLNKTKFQSIYTLCEEEKISWYYIEKLAFNDFHKSNKSLHFMNFVTIFYYDPRTESHLLDEIIHGTTREKKEKKQLLKLGYHSSETQRHQS